MAELVGCHLEEICAPVAVDRPVLGIVEMRVTAVNGEVSVSESTAWTVEWIAIPVLALLKSNLDVNLRGLTFYMEY